VVKRVSERVAIGLTLELALATEGVATVNVETWKKAIKAHPEFYPHYQEAKGKFLEMAMRRLAESDELTHLKWLLERRFFDLFGRPESQAGTGNITGSASVTVNNTVAVGIPEDVMERSREIMAEEMAKLTPKKPDSHG
jgi:hypothetical protein